MLREDDDDKEFVEDLPTLKLLNRRSVELYFMERAFPNVPLFPGAVIEWPDWYFRDRRLINRVDAALRAEKEWERKSKAEADRKRKEM